MSRESLGYVELEWNCPKCGVKNPGPQKICQSCGAPQPADVVFHQAEHQELIQDQSELQQAKKGPDIQCAFCGAFNPADAAICSQCSADLKGGAVRQTGGVIGAFKSGPEAMVPCRHCGTLNPASASTCKQCGAGLAVEKPAPPPAASSKMPILYLIIIGVLLLLCILGGIIFLVLTFRTTSNQGTVSAVRWQRSIDIETFKPVSREGWESELPAAATVTSCAPRYHHTQKDPAPGAEKVCGTPYNVDKGSGYAEVVQDCEYRVSQDYCSFAIKEWVKTDTVTLSGADFSPAWPEPQVASDQRLGSRSETYTCAFQTEKDSYDYTTSQEELYLKCQVGSRWVLNINTFGQVMSIEPAK